jgi:hypothetical protein
MVEARNLIGATAPPDAEAAPPARRVSTYDAEGVRRAIHDLLVAIGEDPDRDGLRDTPDRVARSYQEMFAGLWQEPEDVLTTTFELGHHEMVLVKDIEVRSHCEHHLVPFTGVAHVGRCVRKPATGARAHDDADRRGADAHPRTAWRHRGRRVRAPLHVDAWHPQAGGQDSDLGRARSTA